MSTTWALLIIAATVPAAAEEAQPRVGISFKDCPLTYAPLVGRIVEIELGLSLLDPAGSELDFQSEVTCSDNKVELKAGTPAALGEASQLDLSGQRSTDRPRIIGLKVASLLEQRLADWTPPPDPLATALPAAPPPPPAPTPPEAGNTSSRREKRQNRRRHHPSQKSLPRNGSWYSGEGCRA